MRLNLYLYPDWLRDEPWLQDKTKLLEPDISPVNWILTSLISSSVSQQHWGEHTFYWLLDINWTKSDGIEVEQGFQSHGKWHIPHQFLVNFIYNFRFLGFTITLSTQEFSPTFSRLFIYQQGGCNKYVMIIHNLPLQVYIVVTNMCINLPRVPFRIIIESRNASSQTEDEPFGLPVLFRCSANQSV